MNNQQRKDHYISIANKIIDEKVYTVGELMDLGFNQSTMDRITNIYCFEKFNKKDFIKKNRTVLGVYVKDHFIK